MTASPWFGCPYPRSPSPIVTSTEFSDIVDQHYTQLYRFAYSLAKDAHTAADLTQQAFYVLADKGHQIRERARAKSWLFTTLHREFLKQRRRDQRVSFVEDSEVLLDPQDHHQGDADNARALDAATAVNALDQLDELYRAPLTLFYLQQVSYKEIAAILDIPIGTVMSRLSRGKAQLRKIIDSGSAENVIPFVASGPKSDSPDSSNTRTSTNV